MLTHIHAYKCVLRKMSRYASFFRLIVKVPDSKEGSIYHLELAPKLSKEMGLKRYSKEIKNRKEEGQVIRGLQ